MCGTNQLARQTTAYAVRSAAIASRRSAPTLMSSKTHSKHMQINRFSGSNYQFDSSNSSSSSLLKNVTIFGVGMLFGAGGLYADSLGGPDKSIVMRLLKKDGPTTKEITSEILNSSVAMSFAAKNSNAILGKQILLLAGNCCSAAPLFCAS